ncbi:MAG: hypothetical protein ACI39U_06440, partial [Candidatus Cryptobacteroides sp.]
MKKTLSISLLVLGLCSCGGRDQNQVLPLPYVSRALTDTSFFGYDALADYSPQEVHSAVAVIGDFDDCFYMTGVFVSADFFDNINGRENPDELHDFAGETFAPVFDVANSPYSGFISAGNTEALRETAVAMAVASLGKRCYSNMYESTPGAERMGSKAVVVASPYLCAYAFTDICQLFHSNPPVVSAVDRMFLSALDGEGCVLIAPREELEDGIYGQVWERLSAETGGNLPEYIEFPQTGNTRESFFALLDTCLVQGRELRRLMFVPSGNLKYDEFESLLSEIRTSPGIDMENYRSVLSEDFRFVDAYREAVKSTYGMLRSRNLFTHRISYPEVRAFVTVPANDIPLESNDFGGRIAGKYKYNHSADASV